jgi:hypothetical protein
MSGKLRIRKGEDFSATPVPKTISSTEVGFGIWLFKRKGKDAPYELAGLYRSGMLKFLRTHGFHRIANDSCVIVREKAGVLSEVSMAEVKGFITCHLDEIPEQGISFTRERRNVRASKEALEETYLKQYHLIINEPALAHLYPLSKEILRDDAKTAYFPFKNAIVKVSKGGMELVRYEELGNKCVWKRHIIDRETPPIQVTEGVECGFGDFIGNVTGGIVERIPAFRTAIGYLLHNHTKPSEARAVILYDEKRGNGSTPNGGTGKGVIAKAIGQIRVVTRIDGKGYRSDNQFKFQQVTLETQVVWLDDPKSDFPFSDLFSIVSEGMTIEKKNQTAFIINGERSPKFLLCSNTILSSNGTSHTRRQHVLELDDHYLTLMEKGHPEPIVTQHGGRFFDKEDWDQDEWSRFDLYMLLCARDYLTHGLIPFEPVNVAVNELIQKTSAAFVKWVEEQSLVCKVKYDTKKLFNEFKAMHLPDDATFLQRNFTDWMKRWATFKGWQHKPKPSNGATNFILTVAKCD